MEKGLMLNNGVEIPSIGMGGWGQKKEQVLMALNVGYRLLDTATQYGNEEEFGVALTMSEISRKDVFLTTKLWTEDIRQHRTRDAFQESLERLRTDYVDLYLIHWPAEGYEDAWLEMENLYKEKKIRAIGVSNFEIKHFERLKAVGASVLPAVNQIEIHPYFGNDIVVDYCRKKDILSEAWCPIGGPNNMESRDEHIIQIAEKYNKTPQQVILRWHFQRGVIAIPKTSRIERMKENIDIYDFDLNDEEFALINSLNRDQRLGANPNNFDF